MGKGAKKKTAFPIPKRTWTWAGGNRKNTLLLGKRRTPHSFTRDVSDKKGERNASLTESQVRKH